MLSPMSPVTVRACFTFRLVSLRGGGERTRRRKRRRGEEEEEKKGRGGGGTGGGAGGGTGGGEAGGGRGGGVSLILYREVTPKSGLFSNHGLALPPS